MALPAHKSNFSHRLGSPFKKKKKVSCLYLRLRGVELPARRSLPRGFEVSESSEEVTILPVPDGTSRDLSQSRLHLCAAWPPHELMARLKCARVSRHATGSPATEDRPNRNPTAWAVTEQPAERGRWTPCSRSKPRFPALPPLGLLLLGGATPETRVGVWKKRCRKPGLECGRGDAGNRG